MTRTKLTWNDKDDWPLQWFKPSELACKGSGGLHLDLASALMLDRLREVCGFPLHITSAYRSQAHNKAVGGAADSLHLVGKAFDIRWPGHEQNNRLLAAAIGVGFTGLGFYPPFLHIDTGPKRLWVMS